MLKNKIIVFLIIAISIRINFVNFNNFYHLGDDFAHYILISQSLFKDIFTELERQAYLNQFSTVVIGPNIYPIGYPLLIKFISIFDLETLKYFKIINLIVSAIFLYNVYKFLINFNYKLAIFSLVLFSLSEEYILISSSIEPDLLFSTICLYIINKLNSESENYFTLVLLAIFSMFFKYQGVLFLFLIFLAYLKKFKKINNDKYKLTFIGILYLLIINSDYAIIFGDYSNFTNNFSLLFPNLIFNFQVIVSFFIPTIYDQGIFRSIFIILFILIYLFNLKKFGLFENYNFIFTFFILFYSSYIARAGIRFILFIIPIFIIFIFRIYKLFSYKKYILYLLTIFLILNIYNLRNTSYYLYENNAYSISNLEIYNWVRNNVTDDDVVAFYKPRLLRLETGKNSINTKFYNDRILPNFIILNNQEFLEANSTPNNFIFEKYKIIQQTNEYFIFARR